MPSVTRKGKTVTFEHGLGGRMGQFINKGHYYEEPMLDFIYDLNVPRLFIDVGASIGTHTLYFSKLCGNSNVMSFEPVPSIYAMLRSHVITNNCTNVKLYREALNEVNKLDDKVGDQKVFCIKIDVEGDEFKVIEGAKKVLERDHPYLFIELWTEEMRDRMDAILAPYGYERKKVFNATPTYFYETPLSYHNL